MQHVWVPVVAPRFPQLGLLHQRLRGATDGADDACDAEPGEGLLGDQPNRGIFRGGSGVGEALLGSSERRKQQQQQQLLQQREHHRVDRETGGC